jgi:hypothetical protein
MPAASWSVTADVMPAACIAYSLASLSDADHVCHCVLYVCLSGVGLSSMRGVLGGLRGKKDDDGTTPH